MATTTRRHTVRSREERDLVMGEIVARIASEPAVGKDRIFREVGKKYNIPHSTLRAAWYRKAGEGEKETSLPTFQQRKLTLPEELDREYTEAIEAAEELVAALRKGKEGLEALKLLQLATQKATDLSVKLDRTTAELHNTRSVLIQRAMVTFGENSLNENRGN